MEKSSVDAWFQAEQTGIWASAADTEESVHSRTVFAKYLLQTDDGVYIAIENLGYKYVEQEKNSVIQTRPSFHAPRGKYEWLNYGVYVGSLSGSTENGVRGVNIKIYKMM